MTHSEIITRKICSEKKCQYPEISALYNMQRFYQTVNELHNCLVVWPKFHALYTYTNIILYCDVNVYILRMSPKTIGIINTCNVVNARNFGNFPSQKGWKVNLPYQVLLIWLSTKNC